MYEHMLPPVCAMLISPPYHLGIMGVGEKVWLLSLLLMMIALTSEDIKNPVGEKSSVLFYSLLLMILA